MSLRFYRTPARKAAHGSVFFEIFASGRLREALAVYIIALCPQGNELGGNGVESESHIAAVVERKPAFVLVALF